MKSFTNYHYFKILSKKQLITVNMFEFNVEQVIVILYEIIGKVAIIVCISIKN